MCDTGMGVVATIISCLLLITMYILDLTELEIVNIESKQLYSRSVISYCYFCSCTFSQLFDCLELFLLILKEYFSSLILSHLSFSPLCTYICTLSSFDLIRSQIIVTSAKSQNQQVSSDKG